MIHERMPPGRTEIRHHHVQARQFFFVLTGALTIEMDGKRTTLGPQQGIEILPPVSHQAIDDSDGPVEFLVISQLTKRWNRIDHTI